jgi:curved DNA-binding protein CbpA
LRTDRDYYRILGLPREATADQIKQRYRQLVRQHHPDVNQNQNAGLGHNAFLQIVEAYQILSDPLKREEYDQVWERRSASKTAPGAKGAQAPSDGVAVIETLLADARRYFDAKEYRETSRTCRRVLELDKENVPAHELLGDVLAQIKRPEEAISYYTMAQQLSKARRPDLDQKIERLMRREEKRVHEAIHGKPVYKRAPVMVVLIITLVMFALWGFSLRAAPPIEGFALFDQTPLHALLYYWGAAFLMGTALAGVGQLERFDDEMLFDMGGEKISGNAPPVGLFIPIVSILNFYLALVAYFIYALMHERFSLSVTKAALGVFALGLAFAAPHSGSLLQILLFGTGPGFAIMCLGWLISDVIRPHW